MKNSTFRSLYELMQESFPLEPPNCVVRENWGDYAKAANVFRDSHGIWSHDTILKNRSIINFVNDDTVVYLLPYYINAAYNQGQIDIDILEYLLGALTDSIIFKQRRLALTVSQRDALVNALLFLAEVIGKLHDDGSPLVDQIAYLCPYICHEDKETPQ